MKRSLLICTMLTSFAAVSPQGSFAADTKDRDAARQATAERRAEARRESDARREEARKNRESAREAQRVRKATEGSSTKDGKRASNDSMETQRLTAQAMAEKQRGVTDESKLRPPTTAPSESTASVPASSTDVDKQLRAEETRHAKAMESLTAELAEAKSARDRAGTKTAQAAIEKEMAAYKKRRTELEQQKRPAPTPPTRARTATTPPSNKADRPIVDSSREYKP